MLEPEVWVEQNITVRHDVMQQSVQVYDKGTQGWRALHDVDDICASVDYKKVTFRRSSPAQMHDLILRQAFLNPYDALKEHIASLPAWDLRPRLSTWLSLYGGCEDSPYTRMMGRKWLLSAMARALRPGPDCKVDNVLILHGKQGMGKSTLLKDLAGPFFNDANFEFGNEQKAGMALRNTWIHEWAELDSMTKSSHTRLKSYVSETVNRFRAPYGRNMLVEPRRCVFAGSTNKDDFLTDSTGNRRFWPVHLVRYDTRLRDEREQLLAEARDAFLMGESWWTTREDEALAETYRAKVEWEDPWKEQIEAKVKLTPEVSISHILEEVLMVPLERVDARHSRRVADVLKQLGYYRTDKRDLTGHRVWARD
jgi:putative DNA primase/helicase